MQEFEFESRVMGTELSISVVTNDGARAKELFDASLTRLRACETQFSRFIAESELSRLNTERTLIVSPFFLSILLIARDLFKKTRGYFNPLLQVERLGYTTTYDALQDAKPVVHAGPYNIDFDAVTIDEETRTVSLAPGQKLDFGGFLKGRLAELEAKLLMGAGTDIQGVIVNVGGDMHTRGRDEYNEWFIFEIENPTGGENVSLPLLNTSLATSGTYKRTWQAGDTLMHHILAREGTANPHSGVVSASVVNEHGAAAEAYAKALLSLPPPELEAMLGEKLIYVTILQDGTIHKSI